MSKFIAGQSGNPGGRPKENAEVKALAKSLCLEAMRRLADLMRSSDEKVAKAAADSILDRGLGRPAQVVVGDRDEDPVRVVQRIELVSLVKADEKAEGDGQ